MATKDMPKWLQGLIEKGESVQSCLELWKVFQQSERDEHAAERELRREEMEREVRMRELDVREKEVAKGMPEKRESRVDSRAKLPKFQEGQDPDVFLRSFEKLADLHKFPKLEWPVRLIPLLSGKALETYSRLSDADSRDYDKIKAAILTRYELTAETYREKFRITRQSQGESFREYNVKMENFLRRWCERESIGNDFNKMYDLILKEQLMLSADRDLRMWIQEHKPKNSKELVSLVEAYQTAHKTIVSSSRNIPYNKPQNENWKKLMEVKQGQSQQRREVRTCFSCNRQGHIAPDCPLRNNQRKQFNDGPKGNVALCLDRGESQLNEHGSDEVCGQVIGLPGVQLRGVRNPESISGLSIVDGQVNGRSASVLRDTGSSTVIVHGKLVSENNYTGKSREICLADGTSKECKEVWVDIITPFISGRVVALVMNSPLADLIVGNFVKTCTPTDVREKTLTFDMPISDVADEVKQETQIAAVQTRLQKRKEEVSGTENPILIDHSYFDNPDTIFHKCNRKQLIEAQNSDTSLDRVRELVCTEPQESQSYFIVESDVLFRIYKTISGDSLKQIVVPKPYRKTVLSLGHDILFAGHLGNKKTRDRILQHFFWPGIFTDVALYCRSCPECQKNTAKGRVSRAPLICIPPIEEPFKRIAIDFVGPLPLSEGKNRYVLVCIDYATRYPEAVPLKTQDAETVANALLDIFSRVGIPTEILSDQGSNFMSDLMSELCRLLKIRKLSTTPYHPMANGLVENFNGMLKRMLKAYAHSNPSHWDKYIPFVLFAYREVPNESTGFAPFELLYGRHIRGPLAILKEEWEEPSKCKNSVLSYLLEIRGKMKEMSDIAKLNEQEAKRKQEFYYDKRARDRLIQVGQKVLVLLPTSSSKLLACWKGPYLVTDKVSPVDYKIKVRGGIEKVFHVNMLKLWHDRAAEDEDKVEILSCLDVIAGSSVEEGEADDLNTEMIPVIDGKETFKDVKLSPELLEQEKVEFQDLLSTANCVADALSRSVD